MAGQAHIDYDSPEFKELRRQTLIGILANARVAMERNSYQDARDLARTASDAIHIEFCS